VGAPQKNKREGVGAGVAIDMALLAELRKFRPEIADLHARNVGHGKTPEWHQKRENSVPPNARTVPFNQRPAPINNGFVGVTRKI
jgi:hypothetical protein